MKKGDWVRKKMRLPQERFDTMRSLKKLEKGQMRWSLHQLAHGWMRKAGNLTLRCFKNGLGREPTGD